MTLSTEVQDRYGAQRLIELTNPQAGTATSLDSARLTKAADDVEADFRVYAQLVFDLTDARHVAIAVEGVESYLVRRLGTSSASFRKKLRDDWIESLEKLSKVTSRARIKPKSSSELTPSDENPTGQAITPDFDRRNMEPFLPNNPSGANRNSRRQENI